MTIVDEIIEASDRKISVADVLRDVTSLMMRTTMCIGGEYNGSIYEELPNMWSEGENLNAEQKKKVCDGYDECEAEYDVIEPDEDKPVRILWKFNADIRGEIDDMLKGAYDDDPKYIFKDNDGVIDYLTSLPKVDTSRQFFDGTVVLKNPHGVNDDHRGSDHCEIELPFFSSRKLTDPTFEQFVASLYKLKSHKFDTNYEMYCGSKVSRRRGDYYVNLTFDHGS